MAANADNAKTITVVSNTSLRVGQVIFETSDRTCCINLKGLEVAIIHFFLFLLAFKPIRTKIQVRLWQGQQGSNPRPTVLETAALPAELYPYRWCGYDAMHGNSSAKRPKIGLRKCIH